MRNGRIILASATFVAVAALVAGLAAGAFSRAGGAGRIGPLPVRPSLEHQLPDGSFYTPSTQSLLRGHSWLEQVDSLAGTGSVSQPGRIELRQQGDPERFLRVEELPLSYLVPRFHYWPADPPDRFDAFNLMLAEYSRNGLSVPRGADGDEIAHYRSSLTELVPWKLARDFEFEPNPEYMPQRFSVINNCLAPGLWELSAVDRAGEIYHAWFDLPIDTYLDLVAETNGLERSFAQASLQWSEEPAPLDLGRLRRVVEELGTTSVELVDDEITYSSQGSRRKISRSFALVDDGGSLRPPSFLSDLQTHEAALSTFVPPGLYSSTVDERSRFDFRFLAQPGGATVRRVEPLTSYSWNTSRRPRRSSSDEEYIEITIDLGDGQALVLGNLPLHLLVRQEDFTLHGFGVGILSASGLAERRQLLIERGPRPSFAYLVAVGPDGTQAVNSHDRGVEQVFIRSHPEAAQPHWQITITSYERIVDLARYQVEMPAQLVGAQRAQSDRYITPIYLSYRDDNVN